MEEEMFCFQCQETSRGQGCTVTGICGKQPSTAALMDMLLFVCRGISVAAAAMCNQLVKAAARAGIAVPPSDETMWCGV